MMIGHMIRTFLSNNIIDVFRVFVRLSVRLCAPKFTKNRPFRLPQTFPFEVCLLKSEVNNIKINMFFHMYKLVISLIILFGTYKP